jgi:ribonuclease P protein component
MTPPETPGQGQTAEAPAPSSAVSLCPLETLKNRPDFLRAAQARRQGTAGFLLQARDRRDDRAITRVGYTASKKIGNAVLRNRAKRRLRALVRDVMPALAQPGWDYVLVARPGATVDRSFVDLLADLTQALRQIHRERP